MALKLKKPGTGAARPAVKKLAKPARVLRGQINPGVMAGVAPEGIKESTYIKVFEIPLIRLVEHRENPNQQSERVHDELIEKIRRDGFDEPIIVVPELKNKVPTGNFLIVSGHHRKKAAAALLERGDKRYETVPAVIREGWDEDQAAIELISRNSLTGQMDPYKFTELYDRLKKRYDPEALKKMMGLTEKKAFAQLYKTVAANLPPKQKKKLEDAKENIKSIDDLTGILNNIFTEHGSELDFGFLVFSYGGKDHHYIKVNDVANKALKAREAAIEDAGVNAEEVFRAILSDTELFDNVIQSVKAKQNAKAA